ncbi:hypothetical protein NM688_g4424 [Phlebia brevispora]|uniref:Uncharacterized protein n=1 Tax=Phlebia brevispora TaxID=194682 RepID=A0ACC1T354_9APHY|nr:hypothetical protein NM688_g4424 [Phlebia brevispora]
MSEHLGQGDKFLEMRADQERQHLESGFLGTITVCIGAKCPGGPVLHNISCMGFGDYSKDALKIEDEWKETFEKTVEKMCGRSGEDTAESSNAIVRTSQ